MADDDRYRVRRLDDRELGLPDDPLDGPALIDRLRDAVLLARLMRRSVLPAILTGVMLVAWLTLELLGPHSVSGDLHPAALLLGGAKEGALLAVEPWRLFAAILLHAGAAHFLVNAVGTWFLSQMADNILGWARTVILFIAGGAVSFGASALASGAPSVGASGSVYALLGGLITAALVNRRRLPKAPWSWLAGFGALWVGLSIVFALTTRTTDNAAHLGGFLAGAFLTLAMGRRLPLFEPEPGPTPMPLLAVTLACILALTASFALSVRGITLLADLPDPALRDTALPGLSLPLPSRWAYGRLRDHRCTVEPDAPLATLAADGPLCAVDPYGSVLVLGRAADVVPGVILDPSMMAENGLRSFLGGSEGDVTRRWLVLDRRWTLAFNCYAILADKYDGMLSRVLGGMKLLPTADPLPGR
jgi:membrane associated rhomboid family serine protease